MANDNKYVWRPDQQKKQWKDEIYCIMGAHYSLEKRRKCGVYQIVNQINGKIYVGSTYRTFQRRWREHVSNLKNNCHDNAHLQAAWNLHGQDNFLFEILEEVQEENINVRKTIVEKLEDRYLSVLQAYDHNYGYNISITSTSFMKGLCGPAHPRYGKPSNRQPRYGKDNPNYGKGLFGELNGMWGRHHSDEAKEKISKRAIERGSTMTEENKRILTKKMKGNCFAANKLNLQMAREIRKRYQEEGLSQCKLAKMYNVAQATIYRIIHNIAWKDEKNE